MPLDDEFGRLGASGDPNGDDADDEDTRGPPDYAEAYRPEVPDPGAETSDPAEDLPNVPEPPSPDPGEVPDKLQLSFWWLVFVFNAAVLALWLGLLYVGFRGNWDLGGRLLFAGAVLFVYGLYKYRTNPYRDGVEG